MNLSSEADLSVASAFNSENVQSHPNLTIPESDTSLSLLRQENQKLQEQLGEAMEQLNLKTKAMEEMQFQNTEVSSNQLNERIRKTIAVLVRFSTSAEPIPEQIPDLFREAINTIRSHTLTILHENTELREQCETLDSRLNATLSELNQLPLLRERLQAQIAELEILQSDSSEKQEQLTSLHLRYGSLKDRFQTMQQEHENVKKQLHHYQAQTEQLEHQLRQLNIDHTKTLDQVNHLQIALDILQTNQVTETQYKFDSFDRKLEALKDTNEKLVQDYQRCSSEKELLDQKLKEIQTKNEELNKEIQTLNQHLQHRLSDIAKQHELDREWIGNHIIQFYLHPEQRKDILVLLSNILGFTQEQKLSVGLAHNPTPSIKPTSLSDQWISFLLKESYESKE
ncbi:hypothetical protein HMI56_000336 [Coelomomyces lativittatus]|nr:hypothetical protein HMI56_000336 [Coelomomyces lativittatus]